MGRMKEFCLFLEERGYMEWSDQKDEYVRTVPDIYAKSIMDEYKAEQKRIKEMYRDK